MTYKDIKYDYKNIKRCISFKLIEKITVYNEGEMFNEYTRFYGNQNYVIYNEGNIILTVDENEATVFFPDEEAQNVYLQIIDKIKSNEIEYDGILVIEYNELHAREWEVLQYPNRNYPDSIQPISIYKGDSIDKEKAIERRNKFLRCEVYDDFIKYIKFRGWELTDDELSYLDTLNYYTLKHLLDINRGRNNLIINNK